MILDYPNIRKHPTCPCCNKPKEQGLLVCWACYRAHDFRNGGETRFKNTLDMLEAQYAKDEA
jgi:hypothetical protein